MKKRFLAVLLCLCVILACLPGTALAASEIKSGQCGSNAIWMQDSDGLLTISGTGPMKNYDVILNWSPWHLGSAKAIKINEGITTIGCAAFGWMFSLKTVEIPKSVIAIGSDAFNNSRMITDIYYAGSESDWNNIKIYSGNYTLDNATIHYGSSSSASKSGTCGPNLEWTLSDDGTLTISGNGEMSDYAGGGDGVAPWYMYRKEITSIIIEEGVTSLGYCAFWECTGAEAIKLPNTLVSIGGFSLALCTKIKEIVLPSSLTQIGFSAFGGCYALTSVTFPSGIDRIEGQTFAECTGLQEITIPKDVTSIGDTAFWKCPSLTDVYYEGNESEWDAINIGNDNSCLTDAAIHYLFEPTLEKLEIRCNGQPSEFFDHNLDYLLSHTTSCTYSAEMSRMMIALCNAVHNDNDISDAFHCLGMEKNSRNSLPFITYNVGVKQMKDGKKLVLVTARGSAGADWISNFDVRLNASGQHQGFSDACDEIYKTVESQLGGENFDNTVFVITGHSRGGAAANLLEYKLMSKGVPQSNLYGYNFASPDVAAKFGWEWNPSGSLNNIFNISNAADCVPVLPGVIGNQILLHFPGTTWGKFGRSVWFSKNWNDLYQNGGQRTMNNHGQDVYLAYLKNNPSDSLFKTWAEMQSNIIATQIGTIGKLFGICCPVDVVVKNSNGQPVASVIDGQTNYYNSSFGDVIILTDGEHKAIYVQGNSPLTVELTASDIGTMDYFVQTMDLNREKPLSEKAFTNVSLSGGKRMTCVVNNTGITNTDVSQIPLYVLDDTGQLEKEVLPDGKGTEVTITSNPSDTPTPTPVPTQSPTPTPDPTSTPVPTQVLTPTPIPTSAPWKNPFPDVAADGWYLKAVEFVCTKGLMSGYANGRFAPNDNLSRAQFAQILYNKESKPEAPEGSRFEDVAKGLWYTAAINWAESTGVVSGYGNGLFGPGDNITREQLVTMLWRYVGSPQVSDAQMDFRDIDKISDYARIAMQWAVKNGIIKGKGDKTLDPKGFATRAEVAQMLMNYLSE